MLYVEYCTTFHITHNEPCFHWLIRYRERGNVEVHLFNIQAKLKANGQRHYTPPEGKLVKDIETAWTKLEKAEYGRERALRDELIRWVCMFCHLVYCTLKLINFVSIVFYDFLDLFGSSAQVKNKQKTVSL